MTVLDDENNNAGLIIVYFHHMGYWIPLTHNAKVRLHTLFRALNRRHPRNGALLKARIPWDDLEQLQADALKKGFTIRLRQAGKTEDQISPKGRGGRKYW